VDEISREDVLTELTCFEKSLNDKVEKTLDESLGPLDELDNRTRNLEMKVETHIAGDETDSILEQIRSINHKLDDPERGIHVVQRDLCTTLRIFKDDMNRELQHNNEDHKTLVDNQKDMRKEFKDDSEKYEANLKEFQDKTSDKMDLMTKEISNLRIYGIGAVCMLALLILGTNPEVAQNMMKVVSSSMYESLMALLSLIL
jgi:hypothetical protein